MSHESITEEARKEALQQLRQRRGWRLWLVPKPIDLVTSAFYLSIPALFVYSSFFTDSCACSPLQQSVSQLSAGSCVCSFRWLNVALILGMMFALLAIDRLEYWFYGEAPPRKVAIYLLIARIVFIEITAQLDHFRFSPFLYLLVPFLATLYFGDLVGSWLAALAWIVYLVKHTLQHHNWYLESAEIQYCVVFSLGLVFALTMARVVVRERASRARTEHLLAELEISHRQLQTYAEQVEELAATKERNRLARDIHDSLGHYLTVINVQLEKALAFRMKRPQEADQAVSAAKGLASEALQDVRRSVSALRASENFSAQAAIGALINGMQNSQFTIDWQVEGSEEGFAGDGLMALYRAAQEGLTNIQKHARASQASVKLRFDVQEAVLHVSDNGRGFDLALLRQLAPGREGHYGLQGVQERMELAGGRLQIESAKSEGTHLLASVPKQSLGRPEPAHVQTPAHALIGIEEAI